MLFVEPFQKVVVAVIKEVVVEKDGLVVFGLGASEATQIPSVVVLQNGGIFGMQSIEDPGYVLFRALLQMNILFACHYLTNK